MNFLTTGFKDTSVISMDTFLKSLLLPLNMYLSNQTFLVWRIKPPVFFSLSVGAVSSSKTWYLLFSLCKTSVAAPYTDNNTINADITLEKQCLQYQNALSYFYELPFLPVDIYMFKVNSSNRNTRTRRESWQ